MALRPPKPRRRRSNPFTRTIPDECIGLLAGFILASTLFRVAALAFGLEQWTTSWKVINSLTIWAYWPFRSLGIGVTPLLIGSLAPVDIVVGSALIVLSLVFLASRTYNKRG